MTEDQATVLRIAALKQSAVHELDEAKRDTDNAHEHIIDALSAMRAAVKLESEAAA